jgi:uncharacterized protein (DUF58 family)
MPSSATTQSRPAGRIRRRRTRLSARGWTVLAVGALVLLIGVLRDRLELQYIGYFALVIPLVAVLAMRVARLRLTVRREFSPAVVEVGHPTVVTLDIANVSPRWTAAGQWRDQLAWHPFVTPRRPLPALRPRLSELWRAEGIRVRYELVPSHRGVYLSGPLLIELSDPFGLVRSELPVGEEHPLVVTPATVPLPDHDLSTLAADGSARVVQLRALGAEDDLMTRNYRSGDALRRVHWRASAHHGELMVRQEEQRSHAEARIVIDTSRSGYRDHSRLARASDPQQSAMFERAVSLTGSLGIHLRREGFLVQFLDTTSSQVTTVESADDFLVSLASIALRQVPQTDHGKDGLRAQRSQGAIFAILADAEAETIDRLAAQRPYFDRAVAFLVSGNSSELRERLEAAGWICVFAGTDALDENAWRSLGIQPPESHVGE